MGGISENIASLERWWRKCLRGGPTMRGAPMIAASVAVAIWAAGCEVRQGSLSRPATSRGAGPSAPFISRVANGHLLYGKRPHLAPVQAHPELTAGAERRAATSPRVLGSGQRGAGCLWSRPFRREGAHVADLPRASVASADPKHHRIGGNSCPGQPQTSVSPH